MPCPTICHVAVPVIVTEDDNVIFLYNLGDVVPFANVIALVLVEISNSPIHQATSIVIVADVFSPVFSMITVS